jgi:hypothetical protein
MKQAAPALNMRLMRNYDNNWIDAVVSRFFPTDGREATTDSDDSPQSSTDQLND